MGYAQYDGQVAIDSVLKHSPHLQDECLATELAVSVDGPDEEPLKPDQEDECELLIAPGELAECNQDCQQDPSSREEELEVLDQLSPERALRGGVALHWVLESEVL